MHRSRRSCLNQYIVPAHIHMDSEVGALIRVLKARGELGTACAGGEEKNLFFIETN